MTSVTRTNWGLFQLKSIMPPSNVAACQSYIGWDHLNPTWKLHSGFVKDEIERPLRHLVLSQLGVSQRNNNILIAYGTITWATIYDKFFSSVFTHYLTNMSWGRIDIHTNWLAYFHSWIVEALLIDVPKWFSSKYVHVNFKYVCGLYVVILCYIRYLDLNANCLVDGPNLVIASDCDT